MADGSLIFETLLDPTGFKKGLTALGVLSAKAAGLATAALSAFSVYAAKAGADFGAAMSKVQAISGATADDMARLTELAKKMGATTKFSASESAEALQYMAMAGWDTEKMLAGLPGVMNLAAASGENLGTVSDILTDAMTAFGLAADKSGHFADVLAQTSSKANTNVALLGESFKYVAPLAGALGYSAEDTAVALGLMANAGVKGSQAGTALRSALTRLVKPTKQVLSGFDLIGLKAEELQGLSLRETLDELRNSFDGLDNSAKAQAAALIFGQEAMSGMLAIINASDEDFGNLIKNIDNSAGAAERMAKIMNDNLKGDFTIMKSALEGLGIAFFEGINNPLRTVVQNATGYLNDLSAAFETDSGFAGFFEKIGDVLAKAITDIASYAPSLIQAGIDLIQSLLAGILQNKDQIAQSLLSTVGTIIQGILTLIPKIIETGVQLIVALVDGMKGNGAAVFEAGVQLINDVIMAILDAAPKLIEASVESFRFFVDGISAALPLIAEKLPIIVEKIVDVLLALTPTLTESAILMMTGLTSGFLKALPSIIKAIGDIVMAILKAIWNHDWSGTGKKMIAVLRDGAKSMGSSFIAAIKGIVSGVLSELKASATKFISVGKDMVLGIINGLKSKAGELLNSAKEMATSALASVKSVLGIKSPSRKFRDEVGKPIAQGITVGIKSEQEKLNKSIIELSEQALELAKEKAGNYSEIGKIYSEQMAKGVKKHASLSIDAVKSLIDNTIPAVTKNNKKVVAEYRKAGKEISTAYAKAIKEGIGKVQEEISAEVQRITQEAQKQYDDIIAKKDDMERKLAGFGELFTIDQESGNAVIENINNQIDAIKRYDEVLTNLKSKGAGDDFLNEVTKLGVSEGTKFGEALLKLSDDQFKAYQANWAEKQKLAKEVAMKFYKDQLDALQSDFVNKLDKTLKSVPSTVKNVGVNAIEGMIRGMDSRKQGAINKAREIADAVIAEMQRAMDIHSPSRVMRDLIGKNIIRGIEVGITDEQRNMVARLRSAVESAKAEMSAVVSAKTNAGSRTQTITNNNDNGVQQTVNFYQPVKSAIENAREMKT